MKEITKKSNTIYKGKILTLKVDVVELPNKTKATREIIQKKEAVCVLAVTDNDELLMVKQYRKAVEKHLLEIPAGVIDNDEEPKNAALRELREETGYIANEIKYITEFYTSPGFSNEKIYLYFGTNLKYVGNDLDDEEFLELSYIPISTLENTIKDIEDSKTIIALLYLKTNYNTVGIKNE